MNSRFKILLILVLILFVGTTTYCAFTINVEKTGTIETVELSTTFLDNNDFLTKVQSIYPWVTSIDKTTDLVQATSIPNAYIVDDYIVSTSSSNVPTYFWIDNGKIYYYTAAVTIDINNN